MKEYQLFGKNAKLTKDAQSIMAEDLEALAQRIGEGWDINAAMQVCEDGLTELPITVALVENKLRVVDFLLERGVDLNVKGDPAIVAAANNCKAATIERLAAHGAKIDARDRVGKNAYSSALYHDRYDLLPVLARLGLKPGADRGCVFRQAVANRQYKAVEFFIAQGIDVNLRARDMVYPYNPTAVAVAAGNGDLRMVKLLVEHGADITLADAYGSRPYSEALRSGNAEVQAYLKSLELPDLHDMEQRARPLAEVHGAPAGLIDLLRSENRRMDLGGESHVGEIEFHRLTDVKEVTWRGRTFVDLLASAENYDAAGLLVWSPADGKLAFADYEHGEFVVLCTWDEFVANPGKCWEDLI